MSTLFSDPNETAEEAAAAQNMFQVVVFNVGASSFAMDIAVVNSIIMPQEPTKVPRTPQHVIGVINLRGMIVPIIDLRDRFGIATDTNIQAAHQRILVVEVDGLKAGFVVDSVSEVLSISPKQVQQASQLVKSADTECILGIVRIEATKRLIILLDASKTLTCSPSDLEAMREIHDSMNHGSGSKSKARAKAA